MEIEYYQQESENLNKDLKILEKDYLLANQELEKAKIILEKEKQKEQKILEKKRAGSFRRKRHDFTLAKKRLACVKSCYWV